MRIRFIIELLLLALVIALAVVWRLDHRALARKVATVDEQKDLAEYLQSIRRSLQEEDSRLFAAEEALDNFRNKIADLIAGQEAAHRPRRTVDHAIPDNMPIYQ